MNGLNETQSLNYFRSSGSLQNLKEILKETPPSLVPSNWESVFYRPMAEERAERAPIEDKLIRVLPHEKEMLISNINSALEEKQRVWQPQVK